MELLSVVGVGYGAALIWLIVRMINRPEERKKRGMLAAFLVATPVVGALCLLPTVSTPVSATRRSQCKNNLKQIGLALHNYHETYGIFPPAHVADKNGRPMHSWRVLLLPFIDQAPLYAKYRFDEPWDGPHNRTLADTVLHVYSCPSDDHGSCPSDDHGGQGSNSSMTNYVAIVGAETAWPAPGTTSFKDITDGTSNTLLVVEVANSGIQWMEPRDLHVVQMSQKINAKSGQGISSRHVGGAHVLIADGSVRFIPENPSADALHAWLTADAGAKSPGFDAPALRSRTRRDDNLNRREPSAGSGRNQKMKLDHGWAS